MDRAVRHFSLHRIGATELRVFSDVDAGVIPIVQLEEEVIRAYAGQGAWPHRWVTLFILHDLQPLMRSLPQDTEGPPGGVPALDRRPVLNIYDLADPASCHVFVNQAVMEREGYWDDRLAILGLLAHEHAHPLAENATTGVSRRLKVECSWRSRIPVTAGSVSQADGTGVPASVASAGAPWPGDSVVSGVWRENLDRLLARLVDELCAAAPREVFANEVALRAGFAEGLLNLNRRNVAHAVRGVASRPALLKQLRHEVNEGRMPLAAAPLVMLIGDLSGYANLALETASWYRAGCQAEVSEIETDLRVLVFPALEPEAAIAYERLRERYVGLAPDASPRDLARWAEAVVGILATALQDKGLALDYRVVT